jgi:hypothetical protein
LTAVTVGVPVTVHGPVVRLMPVGNEGEMAHVAPLTLNIPVFTPVLESHVLLPVTETGEAA